MFGLRARLGISEYDETKEYKPKPAPAKAELTEPEPPKEIKRKITHEYKDIDGNIVYFRDRLEYSDGSKNVPYRGKAADQPTVFYGLETLADPQNINYIFLTEGAKCADAVRAALADTNGALDTAVLGFDKAGEWQHIGQAAQDIILSKNIIIFADNDTPGKKNTSELSACLKSAKSLQVVDFADKPQAYDIADWIQSGGTVGDALVKYAKPVDLSALPERADEKPEPEPAEQDFSQYQISHLIREIKPIVETSVMGVKIQYQAIFGILGATSAGKTDVALQLLDEHAKQGISLYLYFEGLPNEIAHRAQKKGISGQNFYAIPALTDFKFLEKFILKFKDKKILIATDYYQALAWRLYLDAPNKNAMIREFMTQIFVEQNRIRQTYENVCFCNVYALNNAGINDAHQQSSHQQSSVDPARLLGAAKEDGNVQYQADYAYCLLFSDDGGKWTLGRHDGAGKIKKYTKLATAKGARIGIETGNPVYIWEKGRYRQEQDMPEIKNNQEKENYYDDEIETY
jgi:hypothetical protein